MSQPDMVGFVMAEPSSGLASWFGLTLPLCLIGWLVAAIITVNKDGFMDTPNRMAQMYGYTVCLVAIVVLLVSTTSIISAAFDRANPLQQEHDYGASLVSFEAYRATYERDRGMLSPNAAASPDTSSEETLRRRYTGLVQNRHAAVMYRTSKSFVSNGVLIVMAAVLFAVHWRWLGRMSARKA